MDGAGGLLGAAQAPDLLVELDAVALLGGFPAFLAADLADLAEMVFSVTRLGRPAAFAASLGSAHLADFFLLLHGSSTSLSGLLDGLSNARFTYPASWALKLASREGRLSRSSCSITPLGLPKKRTSGGALAPARWEMCLEKADN